MCSRYNRVYTLALLAWQHNPAQRKEIYVNRSVHCCYLATLVKCSYRANMNLNRMNNPHTAAAAAAAAAAACSQCHNVLTMRYATQLIQSRGLFVSCTQLPLPRVFNFMEKFELHCQFGIEKSRNIMHERACCKFLLLQKIDFFVLTRDYWRPSSFVYWFFLIRKWLSRDRGSIESKTRLGPYVTKSFQTARHNMNFCRSCRRRLRKFEFTVSSPHTNQNYYSNLNCCTR
jgi:hypothetical protein